MGQIDRSAASLRILGDDLQPAEISRLLNCKPTSSQLTGDVIRHKSGRERTATFGGWWLEASRAKPENLDAQIKWLMHQVTDDLNVWKYITTSYEVDVFCGLFMKGHNDGLTISHQAMFALGLRGVEISFDIYGPDNEDELTSAIS